MLTRDAILAVDDLKREKLDVPEWGGTIYVRTLTGAERDGFEEAVYGDKGSLKNVRARLAALVTCDKDGKRLFLDTDIAALGAKSSAALGRIFDLGMKLNGIGKKDIEDLEKNSEGAPSAASG